MKAKTPNLTPEQKAQILGDAASSSALNRPEPANPLAGLHTLCAKSPRRLISLWDTFVADLASRVKGRVQITTDGWKAYPDTIRHYLLERLDYAVMQKNYAVPASEVEASRRYSPAPFVGITLKIKAGNPRRDRISTSFVERQNLSVRAFNRRFTRLCLGWSRKLANHRHSVAIFVATHNYVKRHSTLGTTPAVGAGLANDVWTVEDLFRAVGEYQVTTLCE